MYLKITLNTNNQKPASQQTARHLEKQEPNFEINNMPTAKWPKRPAAWPKPWDQIGFLAQQNRQRQLRNHMKNVLRNK